MTWYADEILIPASPQIAAQLANDARLSRFAYWVRNLERFEWHSEEHKHELPEFGLIVIRPVRATSDDDNWGWYGEPSLDWSAFQGTNLTAESPKEGDQIAQSLAEYLGDRDIPPTSFRQFLRELAIELTRPVLYYACQMWGGSIDSEYCLSYQPNEVLWLTRSELGDSELGSDDSLRNGLATIGINLPSGFFALHTRSFPWRSWRLRDQV